MSATETEVVQLDGGPMDGQPHLVAADQLGIAVRGPLEREGKRSLAPVLVGVYQPTGEVIEGREVWGWYPMWESAA